MPKRTVIVLPDDDSFRDREGWHKAGVDNYIAVRHVLLVVESPSSDRKNGPAFSAFKWPVGAKLTFEKKRVRTTKSTDQLTCSIESTVTQKLSDEIASSINASATLGADALGAAFGAAMTSKVGIEFTTRSVRPCRDVDLRDNGDRGGYARF